MGVLLAALSALLYGSADFMGGLASRRELALAITWYSQIVGLVTITAVAIFVPAASLHVSDWGWGALGGLAGAAGLLLLYGALAVGPMDVVAPVTAVCSAIVPVVAGVLVDGDRPTAAAIAGIVCALPAIVLVAGAGSGVGQVSVAPRVLAESIVSGAMFGLFFVFFARAGDGAGMWPTVSARLASVSALCLVVIVRRFRRLAASAAHATGADGAERTHGSGLRVAAGSVPLIIGAGALDVGANGVYLVASRNGLLSLISVVSAMYPAATVALARVVLRERLARPQVVGLVLAGLAVGLVAAGR